MNRINTLFTGQWADLPFEEIAKQASQMGFEGLEIACWGDHFDVTKFDDAKYLKEKWEILADNKLDCYAIGNHLMGQCVCDNIDIRHKAIISPEVWADGNPETVRQNAAQMMMNTAKSLRAFMNARPASIKAIDGIAPCVTGFTGSSIWHLLYSFPPNIPSMIDDGFNDFAKRWTPILDEFKKQDIKFALEVHPTEIAFDIASAKRALKAINNHPYFGFNFDPSHLIYQGVNYVSFLRQFADKIFHVHMKDVWYNHSNGEVGVFGGHTDFGNPDRYWEFRSIGRGDVNFEEIIVTLNDIKYQGPLSIEWEDIRMDRVFGAKESLEFVKKLNYKPSTITSFDAAFAKKD